MENLTGGTPPVRYLPCVVPCKLYFDDFSTTISLYAMSTSDKTQLDGAVASGKKMSGVVGYEVPEDWERLEIRFTPDFWNNRDIKFIATN